MKTPVIFFVVALQLLVSTVTNGSNILFYHGIATSSHRTAIWPLAEKLADVGHNVTYIFPMTKRIGSHPKIEEIIPSKMAEILAEFVVDFDINIRLNKTVNQWTLEAFYKSIEVCEAFYDSPETQEWLSRPNLDYDLVFIDSSFGECSYGLVHKFKAKHILFTPIVVGYLYDGFGIVPESSSVPDVLLHAKPTEMTFLNRLSTTVVMILLRFFYVRTVNQFEPIIKEKLNINDLPAMSEFERNTSLIFINTHFVEEYALSLPPLFVSFSGLLCKRDKKQLLLPENLSSFIKDSESFIYVSFGSAVVASAMPTEMRDSFFRAFEAFPSIKFFWRWTGVVPHNTPKNALLLPWFPQQDILAHPKIKGFIFQGGRPSFQEALCYGVPLITMPVFADQDYNADRLEYLGAIVRLDIDNITEITVSNSISELLHNPKYKEKILELSKVFKDRPMDPLENVLYWTEYVLRHDTSLLKPLGMNQTWYERRLLDIYAVLFLTILFIISLILISISLLIKYKLQPSKQKTE